MILGFGVYFVVAAIAVQSDEVKKKLVKDKDGYWKEIPMTAEEIEAEKKTQYTKNPKSEKYSNPNFSHLAAETQAQYPSNSFDNFIAGRMSLTKMFWLYFIFIGIILTVIGGYFHALGYPIIIIFPIAYYALVSVALWNCTTLYKNEKLANRQSYGWAIGVKILIVLNIVMTAIQIWLNFITK
jgi:Flp pilus assembly protein TadB